MNIPHDRFCVLPWVSLEASPVGTVRPCCLADDEIQNDNGDKIHLGDVSFVDIQNTQHMKDLRQQFLDGKQPETCRRCWAEESAGRTSKRMHTLDRLKHVISDEEWTIDAKPLMFLDLKLGNICNLKCRICGSWSSSTYASEEIKFQTDKKNNYHYTMMKMGRWPRERTEFWQELEHNLSGLRYLEFTGGEPFMISEHFDLLKKLVELGHAPDIEIHYNTNGTIYPETAEEIWKHFRHVEIAFSIDDVGDRFEYQRSNARWSEVTENIESFRKMRARNDNISLQVCTTVNVFNVFYLDQVAQWIDQQDFDFVYWNILHDAPQFCIANLSRRAKDLAEATLRHGRSLRTNHWSEISNIINFMQGHVNDMTDRLRRSIAETDQRRDESLSLVAPELARAINYVTA